MRAAGFNSPGVTITPGARDSSESKVRFASGRLETDSVVTVNDRSPLAVCTSGASATMVRTSVVPPTSSVTAPSAAIEPALTAIPERRSGRNDGIST